MHTSAQPHCTISISLVRYSGSHVECQDIMALDTDGDFVDGYSPVQNYRQAAEALREDLQQKGYVVDEIRTHTRRATDEDWEALEELDREGGE